LLFAGAAFCGAALLAESLVNGQASEGFAWFVVMFLCLSQQWVMRLHYSGRFASTSLFHAIIVEQLEFAFIALAAWHIPLANKTKDSSSSSSSSSSTYSSSSSSSSSYGYGSGGDSSQSITTSFTPVDQLRADVDGCTSGFSFFLGCNCLIYMGRWTEVLIAR